MMPRPCRELAIAKSAKFAADRLHADRDTELLPYPLRQIDQTPANHPVDGWDRPTLNLFRQRAPLRCAHQGRRSWRPAVDQAVRALRIEAHHPVPHDLQAHTANTSGIATRATFINRRQSQEPPGLIGIARLASMPAQITGGKSGRSGRGAAVSNVLLFDIVNHICPASASLRESHTTGFGMSLRHKRPRWHETAALRMERAMASGPNEP